MASEIRIVVGALKKFTEQKVRELTLAVTAELIERTPLDTGWAKNNWVPRIGKPYEGIAGSRDSVSSAAQVAGQASVLGWKLDKGEINITNNVPYIVPLNEGHSKQAPAGFVQQAIAAGIKDTA